MKKLGLLILILAFNVNAQDFTCKNNLSSKYEFSYLIKNEELEYKIKSKNGEKIKYIYLEKYDLSNIIGFSIAEKNPFEKKDKSFFEINKNTHNISNNYYDFYRENGNFYSINLIRGVLGELIVQEHNKNYKYYKENESIDKKININKLLNTFQPFIPESNRYKDQKIKFKIKLALDPELNNCAEFETQIFNYDFGSKFWYDIKSNFNIFNWNQ